MQLSGNCAVITYRYLFVLLRGAEYAQSVVDNRHKHAHAQGLKISGPERYQWSDEHSEGRREAIHQSPS